MDIADVAQEHIACELHSRIESRVRYHGKSADTCQNPECGLLISSARQIAVPGCQLCTECAGRLEREKEQYGRLA